MCGTEINEYEESVKAALAVLADSPKDEQVRTHLTKLRGKMSDESYKIAVAAYERSVVTADGTLATDTDTNSRQRPATVVKNTIRSQIWRILSGPTTEQALPSHVKTRLYNWTLMLQAAALTVVLLCLLWFCCGRLFGRCGSRIWLSAACCTGCTQCPITLPRMPRGLALDSASKAV